jgi:hypothetical protein
LLHSLSSFVTAKEAPLSADWSGRWSDEYGQHQCTFAVRGKSPVQAQLLCQFGKQAVSSDAQLTATQGSWDFPLLQPAADFNMTASGHEVWGHLYGFAYCPQGRPTMVLLIQRGFDVVEAHLKPTDIVKPERLCIGYF